VTTRERLSASVDTDLLAQARRAVKEGRAPNVSAWVNDALRLKADHDARLRALDEFFSAYQAEFGEITEQEMREATRSKHRRAVTVRPAPSRKRPTRRGLA
jgi:Arc/MetJ-type ribon-helix-helix transcriptional regulator